MKRLIPILVFILSTSILLAQRIANVKFNQSGSGMVFITYTVYDKVANVVIEFSNDGGKSYRKLTNLSGDYGRDTAPGAHAVDWDANAEGVKFNKATAKFRITHSTSDIGCLDGMFSISESKQIRFAKGNLQYQATTGLWRFANNQYEAIGNGNASISPSNAGWIDLFGWGTSGWSSGARCTQPYSSSKVSDDYAPGNSLSNNLTGKYAKADWGVPNKISNGGDQAGKWRLLTAREWEYLMTNRANASTKWASATINKIAGLVILPDSYTSPEGCPFKPGNKAGYKTNTFTIAQWEKMQAAGAVFLPANGNRDVDKINHAGAYGYYWSSTAEQTGKAYMTCFLASKMFSAIGSLRNLGCSVRLVQE